MSAQRDIFGMLLGWTLVCGAVHAEGIDLGEVLSPSVHANVAVGASDGEAESLTAGHHDPSREEGTVQGIEAGLSLRLGTHVQGFATYTFSYGADEEWGDELEEAFLKLVELPGSFELRGGRMLSRFGLLNARHLHAWDTVDMPLPLGRFLGDDGLILDGGDITFRLPGDWVSVLVLGAGEAKSHHHAHGSEHAHEEHHHDHEGGQIDGGTVWTGRLMTRFAPHDFRQYAAGLSAALGENEAGDNTGIFGVDFSFRWRENGLEPGGRSFRWDTELFLRDMEFSAEEEHADEHDADHDHDAEHDDAYGGGEAQEFGFYTLGVFTLDPRIDLGLRLDYVEGVEDLDAAERFRVSPFVACFINAERNASLRVQYNYDDLEDDEAHSVWLQLGLSLGGAEVR